MGILHLADELLRIILENVTSEPEKLVSLERRAYLSQESFKQPPPLEYDAAQNIAAFRLTCRKFADLGVIHQFSRVTTRFSRRGLKRLENIAAQPHIAQRVKKFSYMVPFFYVEGRERVQDVLRDRPEHYRLFDLGHFQQKVNEQRDILTTQEDARVLKLAITAFTSLQHIQILRVQDREDGNLISYMQNHVELLHLVQLKWPPACLHSTKTIGTALLESRSPCSRFSSPMLSPQSVLDVASNPPTLLSVLAERLTCLELHFDDSTDLDARMQQLSPLARAVFTAAKNIEAVHVGFPSHRPLTLGLEEIFHNIKWDKLQAFGIQAWKLDAQEIIGLAQRHRDTLRGFRLRDVILKNGSRWTDVLISLRNDMKRLEWVSLRRVDYEKHFDEQWVGGAEVPDDLLGSDSSDEDEWDQYDDYGEQVDDPEQDEPYYHHDGSDGSVGDSFSDAGTEEPEQGGTLHFPPMPDTPASVTWCNCNRHMDSVDALQDDSIMVTNQQRKFWEKWVIRKNCTEQHTQTYK